jgi:hypothetical protein
MSIGNTKTNGNKGNNFPYQHAVLELLGQIAAGGGGGGGCCPLVPRVPEMIRASAVGNVTAGKRSVSFYNAGTVSATVLGAALLSGETVSFDAESSLDTLPIIAYNATGTDLLITSIT